MRPSKCALCRKYGMRREKWDKSKDISFEDDFYAEEFGNLPESLRRTLVLSVRGQAVHPSCWAHIQEAEFELQMCKCHDGYIETPLLDADYDSDYNSEEDETNGTVPICPST